MLTRIRPSWVVVALFSCLASKAVCQSSVPSEIRVHAIVGARIEIGDGRVIEHANVVIRDGVIVAVGSEAPPPGAEILDGKGLTVYPGFIDAFTKKGVKAPDPVVNQDAAPPSSDYASAMMREADRKGIRPELQARQFLAITDDIRKPYLTAGFTTVLFAPSGGFLSGAGALVNLSGLPARDSVVIPVAYETVAFPGGFGFGDNSYPGSLLGQIAHVRQALLDGIWYQRLVQAYQAGGVRRPPSDPTLEALQSLLSGQVPAGIEADTTAQIDRAIRLADEFKLHPMLIGGLQAFKRIDRLKDLGAPLILGVNFGPEPKPKDATPKQDETQPTEVKEDAAEDSVPEPPDRFNERLRLFREAAHNAGALREATLTFAFSTNGCKDVPEFMTGLRAAVKNGLPREAALKALTLDAAKVFGLERRQGSIEVGKSANLAVMTGDFLDEKTKVKVLYIDGHRIDPEAKPVLPNKPIQFVREGN